MIIEKFQQLAPEYFKHFALFERVSTLLFHALCGAYRSLVGSVCAWRTGGAGFEPGLGSEFFCQYFCFQSRE